MQELRDEKTQKKLHLLNVFSFTLEGRNKQSSILEVKSKRLNNSQKQNLISNSLSLLELFYACG
jgi:hypothetical protein